MILEIQFTYQEDKHSETQNSFTYFHSKSDDFKKSVTEAGKYFKRFLRENGWTSKAKLKSILTLKNENTSPTTIRIVEPKSTKQSRSTSKASSSSPSSSPKTKKKTKT